MGIFKTNDTEFEMYDPSDGDTIFTVDRASLDIDLSDNTLSNLSDVSIEGDLQLATGQSIEDGGGTSRISITSGETKIIGPNGELALGADANNSVFLQATSNQNVSVFDNVGGFAGFKYTPSSSTPGTLELSNADLDVNSNIIRSATAIEGDGSLNIDTAFGQTGNAIRLRNGDNKSVLQALNNGKVTIPRGNIRLAIGQGIEGENNVKRIRLNSASTQLSAPNNQGIFVRDNGTTRVYVEPTSRFTIFDVGFGSDALQYNSTTTAPGRLELTNANLDMTNNGIQFNEVSSNPFGPTVTWPDQGGGTRFGIFGNKNGELLGEDDQGNVTTLT